MFVAYKRFKTEFYITAFLSFCMYKDYLHIEGISKNFDNKFYGEIGHVD